MALVKLTECSNTFEAEVIKGNLEASGIPCILQGAGFSRVVIGNGWGNSSCMVPVLVQEEDLERAKEVISNAPENE